MGSDQNTTIAQPWLSRVETIVKTITGLSLIIGIAVAIWGPGGLFQADKKMKLDSLSPLKDLVDQDYKIKRSIVVLDWKRLEEEVCAGLSAQRPGHDIYFSMTAPFMQLSTITEHYERMGAMVALGYIPFDLIFEVISFPDDFWRRLSRVRAVLAGNWRGPLFQKRELPDLWENFYYLCERFQYQRARAGSPAVDCRKQTNQATQCLASVQEDTLAELPAPPNWWRRLRW